MAIHSEVGRRRDAAARGAGTTGAVVAQSKAPPAPDPRLANVVNS